MTEVLNNLITPLYRLREMIASSQTFKDLCGGFLSEEAKYDNALKHIYLIAHPGFNIKHPFCLIMPGSDWQLERITEGICFKSSGSLKVLFEAEEKDVVEYDEEDDPTPDPFGEQVVGEAFLSYIGNILDEISAMSPTDTDRLAIKSIRQLEELWRPSQDEIETYGNIIQIIFEIFWE